ncbi:hypothetical protein OPKNFCMD_6546 [Methylobacterium crusticola]|uniref:Guanylate cyclase domain-containing protein n=1 Tax=Methylobacterium crusticola TaxID=1697972 RepID=A0ABQ4R7R7_9HYPH|nr:adenylate/guanylate cyclase domain-containing protein [Methylobacterium crusticola]GJD53768.1 hypothetical protein OPKNFCMD_6546 [Methylobacterium crusticola]
MNSKSLQVVVVALALTVLLFGVRLADPQVLAASRERVFDLYQRLSWTAAPVLPTVIVDIDEASLARYGQWPWPRSVMADMTRRLSDLGARTVGFDIIFAETDRASGRQFVDGLSGKVDRTLLDAVLAALPDHDLAFASALASAHAVLGFASLPEPRGSLLPPRATIAFAGPDPTAALVAARGGVSPIARLAAAAEGLGSISLTLGATEGIVRRVPMLYAIGGRIYPSLSLEALRLNDRAGTITVRSVESPGVADRAAVSVIALRTGSHTIPVTGSGEMWVRFQRERADRYVSAAEVLDPERAPALRDRIGGKVVLVGTSAAGLLDLRVTPLGEQVPGVSIHAQAIDQIIGRDFLERPDWADGFELCLTLVVALGMTLLLLRLGAKFSFLVGGAITASILAASWTAFAQFGLLVDPTYPAVAGLIVYVAVNGQLYIATDQQKRFIRQAFSQYIAPALVHRIEQHPDALKLGGDIRELSILFLDIRDFTALSETLTAPQLITFLNRLFTPISDIILEEFGTIDKYIGDSVMAFWNAPVDVRDHAAAACRAALRVQAAVAAMNATDALGLEATAYRGRPVRIGIGINTGEACVGNMGSEQRFNYSAVGDAVNVAARIEASCKSVGADVLVSASTAAMLPGFALLEVGETGLKGKSSRTRLYALVGDEGVAASAWFRSLADEHAGLLASAAEGRRPALHRALARCEAAAPHLAAFYRALGATLATAEVETT